MAFPDIPVPTGPGAPGDCAALLTSTASEAGIVNITSLPNIAQLQLAVANCLANGLDEITYTVPTGPSAPGNCHAAMLSSATAQGLTGLNRLPGLAQIQIIVANLIAAGITPTIPVPTGGGANGATAAALLSAASRRGLQLQRLPTQAALQIATANLVAVAGGGGGEVDPSLQPFVDGDYDTLTFYEGQWPDTGTDTVLATATITDTVINSTTDITLVFADATPEILATSAADQHKYAVASGAGQDDVYCSLGLSGALFGPDFTVGDMAWYAADHLDLDGTFHVLAELEEIVGYEVEVSTTTPESGATYTSTAQAIDLADEPVNRIGIALTASVVGAGGGSIDPTTTITDRTGLSETLTNTAGAGEVVEHTHVTDGTNVGDGPTVTPVTANIDLVLTLLDDGGRPPSVTDPTVSDSVTVPAGAAMLICVLAGQHHTPVASGLTFTEDVYNNANGHFSIYSTGKIEAGFTGTVSFTNGGATLTYLILKMVPASPCSTISCVAENTDDAYDGTGTIDELQINYPQAFGDTHNLGVSLWGNYTPRAASPRSGWSEIAEVNFSADGNPIGLELQSKLGGDTAGSADWTASPTVVWGGIAEYEAVP